MYTLAVEQHVISASHANAYSTLRAVLRASHLPRIPDSSGVNRKLITSESFSADFQKYRKPSPWNAPTESKTFRRRDLYHAAFLPHGRLFQLIDEISVDFSTRCAVAKLRIDRRIFTNHMGIFPGVLVAEAISHAAASFLIDIELKQALPMVRMPLGQPDITIQEGQSVWLTVQMLLRKRGAEPTRYGYAIGCIGVGTQVHAIGGAVCQLLDIGQQRVRDQIVRI